LCCSGFAAWLSELFNHSAWFWMRLMMRASEYGASLPGAFHRVPAPGFILTSALYLAIIGWGLRTSKTFRLASFGLAAFLGLVSAINGWIGRNDVIVTIIPMRGGHAIVIEQPGRTNKVMIDCGDEQSAAYVTRPFLESRGYSELAALVLTHGDVRHVGGARLIAEEFRVGAVFASKVRSRSPSYRRVLDWLQQRSGNLRRVAAGDVIAGLTVLHPAQDSSLTVADDNAIVLGGQLAGVQVLMLSDLGAEGQMALADRGGIRPGGIVITGLPSRGEALGEGLIAQVKPELVVVADANWPAYSRAPEQLRQRLGRLGVPVLDGSEVGAVTLRLRNGRWLASTMFRGGSKTWVLLDKSVDDNSGMENLFGPEEAEQRRGDRTLM
ncbi:MAG: MBL fold metallo-hydrolase, partial [Verrucomicrobiae bacterium]|nr:MBL fold metallo-hydrolase [Verrucomicrobiae bacterium]